MEGDVPRLSSGTPYLDQILAGGWLRGGTSIVTGPPFIDGLEPFAQEAIDPERTTRFGRSRKPGGRK